MTELTTTEHFARAEELAADVGATALVVCDHEKVVMCTGEPSVVGNCRSIRKSLLSSLFGHHVRSGAIDLDLTLMELGIDDRVPPSLNHKERSATIRDLLMCRSGIYHPSNHMSAHDRAALPPRGSHPPGTYFFYNNWDFNALGTIFEQLTGRTIFDEFAETITDPAAMQDFEVAAQQYALQEWSEHRTYSFRISTRDLARFGQVYLNAGRHLDREVIPTEWVDASTAAQTPTGRWPGGKGPAYGYLWWVALDSELFVGTAMPDRSFAAYGMGSQFLLVIPTLDRVIALLADPLRPGGTDAAPKRPRLAQIVHHATGGAIPLRP